PCTSSSCPGRCRWSSPYCAVPPVVRKSKPVYSRYVLGLSAKRADQRPARDDQRRTDVQLLPDALRVPEKERGKRQSEGGLDRDGRSADGALSAVVRLEE